MEIILLLAIIAVPLIGYIWYTQIVGARNKALEALSGIDAHLQQRADLIPNMLRAAQRFMEHEAQLMAEITALRTAATKPYDRSDEQAVKEHLAAADALGAKMGQLKVQVEAYPDLKSDTTMREAMDAMEETEGQITASRRFYNAAVTDLNNKMIFPGDRIAAMAGIRPMPYFEASEGAAAPINADDYLR